MTVDTASPSPPRVSVLLTTYNGAAFIGETIASVLAQSFGDFELVVVDDNSTDATAAVLADYADPRLRVIRNTANLGVVGARNRGFQELRGDYVATVDHDDLWLPTRLEAGVALLDRDPTMVLAATQNLVLQDGRLRPEIRPVVTNPLLFHWTLLMDCPVLYSSLLFRRVAAQRADGGFLRPDLRYADDYELMVRLAGVGRVAALSEALTVYRVHAANTTWQVRGEMHRHAVVLLSEHLAPWLGDDAPEAARLIARHVARRAAARDRATLLRLGILLRRLVDAFADAHQAGPQERLAIESFAREAYWRALRAGIRSGHVWLLGANRLGTARSVQGVGPFGNVVVSLGAGLLRLAGRIVLRQKQPPTPEE